MSYGLALRRRVLAGLVVNLDVGIPLWNLSASLRPKHHPTGRGPPVSQLC